MKTVGGMFGLPPSLVPRFVWKPGDWLFLSEHGRNYANVRCGLFCLLDTLKPALLWLPSYGCPTLLEPVRALSIPMRFYAVDGALQPSHGWLESVESGHAVLLIDYFGFAGDLDLSEALRQKGAWVIEDASQALLSRHVGTRADYVLFSPRKLVEVPDGGIVVTRGENPYPRPATGDGEPLTRWQQVLIEAALRRREFDRYGDDRSWYEIFQRASSESLVGAYPMSDLSRSILTSVIDYEEARTRRRLNFRILNERLNRWGLYRELPDGTTPLGYPIRTPRRNTVREELFAHRIFPPIHWELDRHVPDLFQPSLDLSREIMTIPCDQRYDVEAMERVAGVVVDCLGKHEHE